ncbi:MAG TPA: histidine ammonia-lyase [Steroidobacteraceae bacterium]|nr:histidine ammonia-lyase [Steroidobacteraceae bacterium]
MNTARTALTGLDLALESVASLAPGARFTLDAAALARMAASRDAVERAVAKGQASYGITTGFGAFANRRIPEAKLLELQANLVRSHSVGVGAPLAAHHVRRILLLKANNLAAGHSGIRPAVVEALLALLAADVLPLIPGRGSVGASGDLAPLAHLSLALIGEGTARRGEQRLEGAAVCAAAGFAPFTLAAKEGLALLNGTQVSTALALDGWARGRNLLECTMAIGALTVEALAGSHTPFDPRIHAARGQAGQRHVAAAMRGLLGESEIHSSHADCDRVQDPYAVRCLPQVAGAAWDTLEHAARVLAAEVNGVSDNPLIFGDDILSGGNFHAAPIGLVADFLAIALTDVASMAERRIDLLDRRVNPALNMFLTTEPGVESGFMMAHVTAAALASENKTLAHPASADSIPTSAGQEDHVSMAPWAGHKLLAVCDNLATILGIELLVAAHALDCQRPLRTTPALEALHAELRRRVPFQPRDHRLDGDIAAATALVESGLVAATLRAGR